MKILVTTLRDYIDLAPSLKGNEYEQIHVFYDDTQDNIPVSTMELMIGKPITLIKVSKQSDIESHITFHTGRLTREQNVNIEFCGLSCAKAFALASGLSNTEGNTYILFGKTKKKAKLTPEPKKKEVKNVSPNVESNTVPIPKEGVKAENKIPDDFMPKPAKRIGRPPKANITDNNKKDAPQNPTPPEPQISVQKKSSNKKKINPEEIRDYFKQFDTKEFKASESAMTLFDAFKRHIKEKTPIEQTLKDILIVDKSVEAAISAVGTGDKKEPQYSTYKSTVQFVKQYI